MYPFMLERLAQIRQQEILEQAARDRRGQPVWRLRWRLGSALVAIGQKILEMTTPPPEVRPVPAQITTGRCHDQHRKNVPGAKRSRA